MNQGNGNQGGRVGGGPGPGEGINGQQIQQQNMGVSDGLPQQQIQQNNGMMPNGGSGVQMINPIANPQGSLQNQV